MKTVGLALLLAGMLGGCVGEPEAPSGGDGYTLTRVRLNPDGSRDTRVEHFPKTEAGVKQMALLTQDPTCYAYGPATWFYDETNLSGNMLCVEGTGTAPLALFCRIWWRGDCLQNWSHSVRSVYGGEWVAFLYSYQPGDAGLPQEDGELFYPWTAYYWVTSAAQQSEWLSQFDLP